MVSRCNWMLLGACLVVLFHVIKPHLCVERGLSLSWLRGSHLFVPATIWGQFSQALELCLGQEFRRQRNLAGYGPQRVRLT